jgi:molybdopterin synthase sulfur carrier subunit
VKVTVRFFASVKEQLGKELEEIELPAGISTVGGLRAHLRARGGRWAEVLAETRRVTAAVNQDMVKPGAAIKPGDEVAFFPPVTGG